MTEARDLGELAGDPSQLAFDLNAFMESANLSSLLRDDVTAVFDRARQSVRTRLEAAATAGTKLPWA